MWEWELEWSTVWAARDPAKNANGAERDKLVELGLGDLVKNEMGDKTHKLE